MSRKYRKKDEAIPAKEDFYKLPELQRLKYMAAEELGLYEKIQSTGWSSLTYSEAGKIGGYVSKMRKRVLVPDLQTEKNCI